MANIKSIEVERLNDFYAKIKEIRTLFDEREKECKKINGRAEKAHTFTLYKEKLFDLDLYFRTVFMLVGDLYEIEENNIKEYERRIKELEILMTDIICDCHEVVGLLTERHSFIFYRSLIMNLKYHLDKHLTKKG